jgi:hypothetical protein
VDETCWFLAADFDQENWAADALAVIETCRVREVPAALDRSRSGHGGHVWIFFSEPVAARTARQLGAAILTQTVERRPEIGFASYDRLFPSQDTMPIGGFGNLIALPRRARENGNSVFIDMNLRPYGDQWAFLSSLRRLSADAVSQIVGDADRRGLVLGVRMPVEDDNADEPWRMTPSRRQEKGPIGLPLPKMVTLVVADQVYIDRAELPSAMIARLIRLAAFQNPEFYRAQSMRFPSASRELFLVRNSIRATSPYQGGVLRKPFNCFELRAPTSRWKTFARLAINCRTGRDFGERWTARTSPHLRH